MKPPVKNVFRSKTRGTIHTKNNLLKQAGLIRAGYYRLKQNAGHRCECGETVGYEMVISNRAGTEFWVQTFGVCKACGED
jgi:hypothetical protein